MSICGARNLGLGIVFVLVLAAVIFPLSSSSTAQDKEKLTAEEVLARHLKSIGTTEDIAAAKTRVVAGTSLFTAHSPGKGQNSGLGVLFSEANKTAIAMTFANPEYPHEKFGYDGQNLVISYVKPGVRSQLGEFIFSRTLIIKDGLLGGTLSTAWPLLALDNDKARLEYGGTKKIDGQEAYVLKYVPRKGSDVKISLYFDRDTFRHVRTEYSQTVSAQMGATADATKQGQRELRYELEEQFADFKQEGKLTLPHKYTIKLMLERTGTTYLADWVIELTKFSFNQPLDRTWFDVNTVAN